MLLLKEQKEKRETQTEFDGTKTQTRFFKVSKATYEWLEEHGCLSATALCGNDILSVAAFFEDWGSGEQWNGWNYLHDDFLNSGMCPADYGL